MDSGITGEKVLPASVTLLIDNIDQDKQLYPAYTLETPGAVNQVQVF